MAKQWTTEEAQCPVCGVWNRVVDGKLGTHGPGPKTFHCPGGGQPATATRRRTCERVSRKEIRTVWTEEIA